MNMINKERLLDLNHTQTFEHDLINIHYSNCDVTNHICDPTHISEMSEKRMYSINELVDEVCTLRQVCMFLVVFDFL